MRENLFGLNLVLKNKPQSDYYVVSFIMQGRMKVWKSGGASIIWCV